jgi:hypothetical protein
MSEERMTMGKNIFLIVVTALVTSAITFGVTSESIVTQTHLNTRDIEYLQKRADDGVASDNSMRMDFTARMTSIAALVSEQSRQATELITLIKLQQQQQQGGH